MKSSKSVSVRLATLWIVLQSLTYQMTLLTLWVNPVDSSTVSSFESTPRPNDLLCVCGKGGTCLDRTVDIQKIPRGSEECFCNISKGFYKDCRKLEHYCETTVCENEGSCFQTFGGFYCNCSTGFIGPRCERKLEDEEVTPAQFPMTFNFIHTTANKSKQLFLGVQSFGTDFKAFVNFNDGRDELHLTMDDFNTTVNIEQLCDDEYNENKLVHDRDVCTLLGESAFYSFSNRFEVAIIEPDYPLRVYSASDPGRVDNVTVTMQNSGIVIFHQNINFFTPFYGVHNYVNVNPCQFQIVFRGCGSYYNTRRNYRISERFKVTANMKVVRYCNPIRKRIGYWRYYPNNSNYYIEEVEEMKKREGITSYHYFEPFTFKPGRRWIEFHLKEIGNDRLYGLSNEYISRGRCSINIRLSQGDLFIVGGTQRTYPCYELLNLELASTDPSFNLEGFIVEWSCQITTLSMCEKRQSQGNIISYADLPCGQMYHFTATLKTDEIRNVTAFQTVDLKDGVPEFYITCIHNCLEYYQTGEDIRLSFEISIVADRAPVWEMLLDGEPVSVRNRTDRTGILIQGMKDERFSNSSVRGEMKSTMTLKRTDVRFRGTCKSELKKVNVLEQFNILCQSEDNTSIQTLMLVENTEDWGIFGEPVAHTNDLTLFNVQVMSEEMTIYIFDQQWWEPIVLKSFKPPTLVKREGYDVVTALELWKQVDKEMLNGNYIDAVSNMNRVLAQLYSTTDENNDLVHSSFIEEHRFGMIEKLAKFPATDSLMATLKQLFIIRRLGRVIEDQVKKKGQSHLIMRYLSVILKESVSNYASILNKSSHLVYMEGTKNAVMPSVFDLVDDLMVMPYNEFIYRKKRADVDFSYFLFETKYGGDTLLELLELVKLTFFEKSLYADWNAYRSPFFYAFFQTDTLALINKKVEEEQEHILSNGEDNTTANTPYCYTMMSMRRESFWWVGDYFEPKVIIGAVTSATYVDYTTKKRVLFPNNLIRFSLVQFKTESFWSNAKGVLVGETKTARDDDTDEQKDRSLMVWQLDVPLPSAGILFLFPSNHTPLKIYRRLGQFPSYSDVFNSPVRDPFIDGYEFNVSSVKSKHLYVAALPKEESSESSVSFSIFSTGIMCLNYIYNDWRRYECRLQNVSIVNGSVVCSCPRVTWHAVEKIFFKIRPVISDRAFKIPPESLNFFVFGNLIVITVLFVGLFAWAHWTDEKKFHMNVLHLIEAPQVEYNYLYLISVYTGNQLGSGTDSSVGFRLIGQNARYGPHLFRYRMTRDRLAAGHEDWFLIQSPTHLGQLTRVDVWNDFTGIFFDWYCEKIIVYDLTLMVAYDFLVQKWLSQQDFSGCASYSMKRVHGDDDLKEGSELDDNYGGGGRQYNECVELRRYIVNQICESHHWISFLLKSKRNIYSNTEHAVILISFVSSIMSNAMLCTKMADTLLNDEKMKFKFNDAMMSALVLAIAYIGYALEIYLFEKSCHPLKKFKPVNSKNFQYERARRRRSAHAQKRFETTTKRRRWVNKHIIASHLFAPSSYYPWFDSVDIRKASRPKIFGWNLAWKIVSVLIIAGSLAYLSTNAFTRESRQWIVIYWGALIVDAIFVHPLWLTIKSIFLFYCGNRSTWDNFYILGICESRVDEANRSSYYREFSEMLLTKIENYEKIRKYKAIAWAIVSSKKFSFASSLAFLIIVSTANEAIGVKPAMFKIRSLQAIAGEPSKQGHIGLKDVRNASQLAHYITLTFLPSLHRYKWYNGRMLPRAEKADTRDGRINVSDEWSLGEYERGWVADYCDKIMGIPIMRQLRVRPRKHWGATYSHYLNNSGNVLNSLNLETRDFLTNWTDYEDVGQKRGTWTYSDDYGIESLFGNWIMRHRINGYIHEMTNTLGPPQRNIITLYLNNWFDDHTRYVSLHYVTVNVPGELITYAELRVSVSPQLFYQGTLRATAIPIAWPSTYVLWITMPLILALLGILRILIISKVRGYNNYSKQPNFIADVLLVVGFILFAIFYSLRILRKSVALSYIYLGHPSDFLRVFEVNLINLASFAASGAILACLVFITLLTWSHHARIDVIHDDAYNGVGKFSLVAFLLFACLHKLAQGFLFNIFCAPEVDLFIRAALSDYGDFIDQFLSINDLHVRCLACAFICLRLLVISAFVKAYRGVKVRVIPVSRPTHRGREIIALPSISKPFRQRTISLDDEQARKMTLWRWI